jgi:gliding motility-associated-like protein
MKILLLTLTAIFMATATLTSFSQTMVIDGSIVHITNGAIVISNGGVDIRNNSLFTNDGNFDITKNSSFPQAGNLMLTSSSSLNGNGSYYVEQDWINDALFTADNSIVQLYGNTQQSITSTNGTNTTFNNLTLSGTGNGTDRKKSLVNCDAYISANGVLAINNRELETQTNNVTVLNPSLNAISNSTTFGSEGFVSSLAPGYLYRATNSISSYNFPLGSSDGTLRYRPITISPATTLYEEFSARLNNYDATNDGFDRTQHDGSLFDANANYYHSIEQNAGTANAAIQFFYLPNQDGEWFSSANWKNSAAQWQNMDDALAGSSGNFSTIVKNDWDFSGKNYPYILATLEDGISIPNVFTPNSDGINDKLIINNKNISEFNMTIVNRWGNSVFETSDINAVWDGTSNNELCSEGVYFYIVTATATTKKEYKKQGFITLKY